MTVADTNELAALAGAFLKGLFAPAPRATAVRALAEQFLWHVQFFDGAISATASKLDDEDALGAAMSLSAAVQHLASASRLTENLSEHMAANAATYLPRRQQQAEDMATKLEAVLAAQRVV